jgi:uncharacterized protein YjbI with pentapeptide repeats
VLSRLQTGTPLDGLELGEIDGHVDLRGLPLPVPGRTPEPAVPGMVTLSPLTEFDGVRLDRLDLRHARLDHARFFHTTITDCRFDAASCYDWRLWAIDVTRCGFVGTDLSQSSFGAWCEGRGNTFTDIDFTGARLDGVGTNTATYVDCNFSEASLDGVNFWQSSLIRATFAGPLKNVIFDGRMLGAGKPDPNPMEDVDLSATVMSNVNFRGVRLDRVRLPDDPDLAVYDRTIVERALALLPDTDDSWTRFARDYFERKLRFVRDGGQSVTNFRDFGDGDQLRDMLVRAGWSPTATGCP